MKISIRDQTLLACRRLLNQLNRDKSTPTFGCFDRRYWAWKLVDFPEATFQRNIKPLCWFMDQEETSTYRESIAEYIKAGLHFSLDIQHKDGSYDQAYPNEHSYGATAFLLPDLISAYESIKDICSEKERGQFKNSFKSSADFLCKSAELHGLITNHLAGAALALKLSHQLFHDESYNQKYQDVLNIILDKQSEEGWFPEYGGADPGYQTLCMYYLAQIYQIDHSNNLQNAIEKSLHFLQFFAHPDGTFGGEYGSRRTEIYYPGGIAMLASQFPAAASLHTFMKTSIESGATVNLIDIDMGNLAPLLSNYAVASQAGEVYCKDCILPFHEQNQARVFNKAGLAIISRPAYYAILGISNGGILKIFSKPSKKIRYDDCGFLGVTTDAKKISNQITDLSNPLKRKGIEFKTSSHFYRIPAQSPTPFNYLLLRIANLTIMRMRTLNELVKKALVKMLINKKSRIPMVLKRTVIFKENSVQIKDKIEKSGNFLIASLASGIKFSSIHMASTRYFSPAQLEHTNQEYINTENLQRDGYVEREILINFHQTSHGEER